MIRYYYQFKDLSHARKVFVVGDIHGCFTLLENKLEAVGFDKSTDHLVSVGDLVDRGPENERFLHFIDEPWFHWILGNHEVMATEDPYLHLMNGGSWLQKHDEDTQDYYRRQLIEAPLILQIKHPNGKHYGFAHAAYTGWQWDVGPEDDGKEIAIASMINDCLWDREQLYTYQKTNSDNGMEPIVGIEHVYHGHTPLKEPFTFSNETWLDTGAFFTGKITVLEII